MGFLTEQLEDRVGTGGYTFSINATFDVILDVQSMYKEDGLTNVEKMNQALKMLVINQKNIKKLTVQDKANLLNGIYDKCVNTRRKSPKAQRMPTMDFEEDGEYIYASFMMEYGIDLVEAQGCLHWKKFIALFQGLSSRSKIREVIRVRTMDIPIYNGKNSKEIQEIQELKSYYALPVKGGGGQNGLDLLFTTLEGMAVKQDA